MAGQQPNMMMASQPGPYQQPQQMQGMTGMPPQQHMMGTQQVAFPQQQLYAQQVSYLFCLPSSRMNR